MHASIRRCRSYSIQSAIASTFRKWFFFWFDLIREKKNYFNFCKTAISFVDEFAKLRAMAMWRRCLANVTLKYISKRTEERCDDINIDISNLGSREASRVSMASSCSCWHRRLGGTTFDHSNNRSYIDRYTGEDRGVQADCEFAHRHGKRSRYLHSAHDSCQQQRYFCFVLFCC